MTGDLFTDAIRSPEHLRDLYEAPSPLAARKQITEIDEMARRFIACSPLVFISSASANGSCDVTPRGGPAGFVSVLDEQHLVVPDATGNKRLDTWQNVIETGRAGLLFVIPGRGQTLRVNGSACVSARPELLDSLTAVGKPPRSALVVRVEEVYAHCPKAFVRSKAWQPEHWLDPGLQPSPAEVTHAHLRMPEMTIAMVEQSQRESLLYRLE
ncbi:pyridoxamine 5'-phosphate oxidase family protein [Crossiella sp. CA-258035]|uniref:MSMEG_1061 family FMN-dependent PPOX-type flavoprotein n=1 Tax=Crossiella sp. CA-258035 TaxID=2981138 RepID=UPI0024BBF4F4|nr:MSMEG_1061 family FMN-dependent PPOX-type flavoprotein [Crossiella sp. CA-258035]WHT15776.1 pyridoxamine 5'-phosphate oxidase family protein [Crossiella sp. CA-258035]